MSDQLGQRPRGTGCLSFRTLSILRGQLISCFIAGTGFFATFLSSATPNANFPQFMNTCNYILLSGYFWRRYYKESSFLARTQQHDLLATSSVSKSLTDDEESKVEDGVNTTRTDGHINFLWYILAAALDVEGNYLFIKAYDYTSITSIMLLDCFTIPSAMLLSYLFLNITYKPIHLLGIAICISGLVCIVISDLGEVSSTSSSFQSAAKNQVLGDLMCIAGSVLYASSNVLQEKLVKNGKREVYMGNVGMCGIVIAGIQFCFLDLPRMSPATFNTRNVLSMSGFVACLFFMYTNTSSFLQDSDAVLFNLSLLTSDVYAVVFSYFRSGHLVPWMYFVSFALVVVGLLTYYSEPPISSSIQSQGVEESNNEVKDGEDEQSALDAVCGHLQYNPLARGINGS